MSAEVMGVPLSRFEGPIRQAVRTYEILADNGLQLDSNNACKLELTPTRPNSARSVTEVLFMAENIGKLYIIAFKYGDGTGDELNGYKLEDLEVDEGYPRSTLVVPRNKTDVDPNKSVHHEAHLTIVTHKIEDVHAEPVMFAGRLDVLGLKGKKITKIGQLGYSKSEDGDSYDPLATFTVGFDSEGERFGDPHAVYDGISDSVQVGAFLAVTERINNLYPHLFDSLAPQMPTIK
jgi:hypothetical protein